MARFDPTVFHQAAERIAQFWARVAKAGPDECWLWQGGRTSGYGRFYPARGVAMGAHCFSRVLSHGPIPPGFFVCHNCPGGDNPLCVNPAHLWLGTNAENQIDALKKERACFGERNHKAKLTAASVRTIRACHAAGWSAAALARRYGIHESQLKRIVRRESWRHVP